ncbi:transporter [Lutibacter sp.]|uniref:transporter n=1 Tax=Lutibacter sp. TaxID=1925666 RepID=UPI002735EA07|nr:transporter [Lutibacter sp.]MDP3314221.1 transporter [Lutibacter sp.]
MKIFFYVLVIILNLQIVHAQYTEIINSKRPGFSESPYGVGTDVMQFESGLFYQSNASNNILVSPSSMGGELFFRYGKFKEKLEFNASVAYQSNEINNPFGDPIYHYGVSQLTIGAKYLFYQKEYTDKTKEVRSWKKRMAFDKNRLIPSVGAYVGVHTNFLGKDFKEDGISYKGAVLLQNDFSDRLVVLTNLYADKITSLQEHYSYIVTMTYAVTQDWSFFLENQGKFYDEFSPNYQFGTGVAYLVSPNLQLDASVRSNLLEDYGNMYLSTGFSWRLDRHQDSFTLKNSPQQNSIPKRRKGGFFSRIFGKKRN